MVIMNKEITFKVEDLNVEAGLNDSKIAQVIWEMFPLEGYVNTWGDEIYFSIQKTY